MSTVAPATVVTGIGELVTCDGTGSDQLGLRHHAALVAEGGRVTWIGPSTEAPAAAKLADASVLKGRLWIDHRPRDERDMFHVFLTFTAAGADQSADGEVDGLLSDAQRAVLPGPKIHACSATSAVQLSLWCTRTTVQPRFSRRSVARSSRSRCVSTSWCGPSTKTATGLPGTL